MKSYSIFNQKGGSGKSTLSANLSVLWSNSGYKVAVIDADALKNLFGEARKSYYGEDDIGITQLNFDIRDLIDEIKAIKRKYDFIIIDSPPSITFETMQVVKLLIVFVPVQPSQ